MPGRVGYWFSDPFASFFAASLASCRSRLCAGPIVHHTIAINKASASNASATNIHMRLFLGSHGLQLGQKFTRAGFALAVGAIIVVLSSCTTTPPQPPTPPPVPTIPVVPPPETAPPADSAKPRLEPVAWDSIPGWREDALTEAWPAFLASCNALAARPAWRDVCTEARAMPALDTNTIRAFFEARFVANRVTTTDGNDTGLVTGYYEPLLRGSRVPIAPYLTPLHGVPDDLLIVDLTSLHPEFKGMRLRGKLVGRTVVPYPPRAELADSPSLRGKELLWVDNPVEAFFLEIQGSGRVQLFDANQPTEIVRIAYADQNGQPYKSIGRWLVDQGEMTLASASMQNIKAWAASHPARLDELLNANPGAVFFKEEKIVDPSRGPNGALGVPLTPQRSIAVDARVVPLGAPVFLATTQPLSNAPLQHLMMAQDTGGAIAAERGGAVRADYFWGFGNEAGNAAGRMKQQGRMWVLLPK